MVKVCLTRKWQKIFLKNVGKRKGVLGKICIFLQRRTGQITVIKKRNNYYPFGMSFNSYTKQSSTEQNFLFNGKERDEVTGWDDFGARMYMSDLGGWGVVDPLASYEPGWTPYRFAFNNPLRYSDPSGLLELDQIIDIFNNAPEGRSSYDSDGNCTCGCPGTSL
ncbi:RHS repeat-associated core domain-containing protein [Echinicola soli]|uniref:RHS repeat-associated core domain-containing protein n=1 Tax=Echinicola soli TaxID=2591634 RepID=A0A514CL82_9BACT|nr:RHS repeat-associated core domain-containing protein [Echinicola soli]QDH80583.1 RHS repeat-associated core domain-containing protein [Echinicola soli]